MKKNVSVLDLELLDHMLPINLKLAVYEKMLMDDDLEDPEAIVWVVRKVRYLTKLFKEPK